jgi:hypothetical protein
MYAQAQPSKRDENIGMMTDRLAKFRNRKAAKASGVTPPKTPPLGPGGAPALAAAVNGTGDVGEGRDGEGRGGEGGALSLHLAELGRCRAWLMRSNSFRTRRIET